MGLICLVFPLNMSLFFSFFGHLLCVYLCGYRLEIAKVVNEGKDSDEVRGEGGGITKMLP